MPYIAKNLRERLEPYLSVLLEGFDHIALEENKMTVGELNYIISNIALKYLRTKGESYQHYNDIIGALECSQIELYRRFISNYEDIKRQSNGDIDE